MLLRNRFKYRPLSMCIVISFLACSRTPAEQNISNESISSIEIKSIQNQIDTELVVRDDKGSVKEIKGLTQSDLFANNDFESRTTIDSSIDSESNIFDFIPPDNLEADFSEPVMVSGASLLLTGQSEDDYCRGFSFESEEPKIENVLDKAKETGICGQVDLGFCIRLTKANSNSERTTASAYALAPELRIIIPCPEDSFNGLEVSLNGGAETTSTSTVSINVSAGNSVSDLMVSNKADCSDGDWQVLSRDSAPIWALDWSGSKTTATVYFKFRDIYRVESECLSDSISYKPFAFTVASGAYTASGSVSLFPKVYGFSEMYISNSADCTNGGTWEPYSEFRSAWNLGQSNSTATVYIKFRDLAGTESNCFSDSIIHDDTSPTAPTGLSLSPTHDSAFSSPNLTWTASTDSGSGLSGYQVSFGTSEGLADIGAIRNIEQVTSYQATDLNLTWGQEVYINLQAIDNSGIEGPLTSSKFKYGFLQQSFIKAANADTQDYFGSSLGISGDTLVVSAYSEDSNQSTISNGTIASSDNTNTDSGAIYVFKRSGASWAPEAYIKAANGENDDFFGEAVAIDGDTIAVGVPEERSNQSSITNGTSASNDNSNIGAGAVYIYKRSGTNWAQEAYIKASDSEAQDNFGNSVAISGNTLVVGSWRANANSGAAYVFVRSGSTWSQQATITPANLDSNDSFGFRVGIDGETLVITANWEDSNSTGASNGTTTSTDNSILNSGAAYVYTRSGTTWTQQAFLKAANPGVGDLFGDSVSISGDTVVVGATSEDSGQNTVLNGTGASADNSASGAGAAYVFKRTGTTWAQEAYLKASHIGTGDGFGSELSISGDTIVLGARTEDSNQQSVSNSSSASNDNSAPSAGAAYIFERLSGIWVQRSYLKAPNATTLEFFGSAIGVSGDTVAIGATFEGSDLRGVSNGSSAPTSKLRIDSGAAYIFDR